MHQEMGQIQTEVRIQENTVTEEEKLVEKLEIEALTKQVYNIKAFPEFLILVYKYVYLIFQGEVSSLQNKPIQIQKEADRESQKLEQLQDMYQNLCQKQLDGMDNFRTYQGKIDRLTYDLNSLIREKAKLTLQKKNSLREIERLMTQMEALMTREQIMLDKV